jgi:hypothetical protein
MGNGLITRVTGAGKCLGYGTPIIMYDGKIKEVQDIENGDLLMGPDNKQRLVGGVTVGNGELYKITPLKGESFIANSEHILSLKISKGEKKGVHRYGQYDNLGKFVGGDIVNISINDYFKTSTNFKHKAKLYNVPIDFNKEKVELKLNPYFLGLWLGDGDERRTVIANVDKEIVDWTINYGIKNELKPHIDNDKRSNCKGIFLTSGNRHSKPGSNKIRNGLKYYNLIKNKHVPNEFKFGDRNTRFQLLAGYLDAEGNLDNKIYRACSVSKKLADDIIFIARSLGFKVTTRVKKINNKVLGLTKYYCFNIIGNVNLIPCLVKRKQATERKQIKDWQISGFKIEPIGIGNYYGFTLDKDGLFLLGDFTVTHNTNTSLGFFANKIAEDKNYSAVTVVPKGRTGQWIEEARKFTDLDMIEVPENTTKEERAKIIHNIKPGQIAVISQRDAAYSYYDLEAEFNSGRIRGLSLDEPQEIASKSISGNMSAATRKIMKLNAENRIALTATPARDNLIEAYDLVNWVSHKDKKLGPRKRFQNIYGGYGSGTNAQDAALQQMIYREISPYLSGDRLSDPNFKVKRNEVLVKKTSTQDINMKNIEANADSFIRKERDAFINGIINDPEKLKRYESKHGKMWKSIASQQANKKARERLIEQHYDNLSGVSGNMIWKDNPKITTAVSNILKDKTKKHVIFLDNKKQRIALTEGLLASGYSKAQIQNIAATTTSGGLKGIEMSERAKKFKQDENSRIIFIDKQSASGYNLQEGDDLHVLGTPSDAANYMQAQGRVARMPRKGDVTIHTYKYEDVPFEDQKWTKLENQLAILKATAPGLMGGKHE